MNDLKKSLNVIQVSEELKERTKNRILRNEKKSMKSLYIVALACCVFLFFICVPFMEKKVYASGYISIDSIPSIEITLDQNNDVLNVKHFNVEGEEVLKNLKLNGKHYVEAIHDLMNCQEMCDYLKKSPELSITITDGKGNLKTELMSMLDKKDISLEIQEIDSSLYEDAQKSGLSIGKYLYYMRLKELDDSLSEEAVHHMNMEEIKEYEKSHGCAEVEEEHHEEQQSAQDYCTTQTSHETYEENDCSESHETYYTYNSHDTHGTHNSHNGHNSHHNG